MKYDLRIEFKETDVLLKFIEKSYKNGYLINKKEKMIFKSGSIIHSICKGLTNLPIRFYNDDLIEGTLRFIIIEEGEKVYLYPCSIHYDLENKKYSFLN